MSPAHDEMTRMAEEVLSGLQRTDYGMPSPGKPKRVRLRFGARLAGAVLGMVLLGWAALAVYAPGLAAMVAVFGSPFLACAIILRILTLTPTSPKR
jgi:hypothetical protein